MIRTKNQRTKIPIRLHTFWFFGSSVLEFSPCLTSSPKDRSRNTAGGESSCRAQGNRSAARRGSGPRRGTIGFPAGMSKWNSSNGQLRVDRARSGQKSRLLSRAKRPTNSRFEPGEHFVIGETTFSFVDQRVNVSLDLPRPAGERTFSVEELRAQPFPGSQQTDRRAEPASRHHQRLFERSGAIRPAGQSAFERHRPCHGGSRVVVAGHGCTVPDPKSNAEC